MPTTTVTPGGSASSSDPPPRPRNVVIPKKPVAEGEPTPEATSPKKTVKQLQEAALQKYLAKWVCLAVGCMPKLPIPVFVDNQSAVTLGSNPIQNGRNLHMHARYFYVRDMIKEGEYLLHYLSTKDMISDVLVTFKGGPNHTRLCAIVMGCAYLLKAKGGWVWQTEYLD